MKKKLMNDLLDERDKRTKVRKEIKKKMDSIIGLSYKDDEKKISTLSVPVMKLSALASDQSDTTARLLDEGFNDQGFIIKKDTLEKYLNGQNEHVKGHEYVDGQWQATEVLNLNDEFVGTINLGHEDFATFPFILGEFTKADFSLVDIGNDRKGLDVNVRLDEESMYVKELRRLPYDISLSAEFVYHVDWDETYALEETYGIYLPVIDEIFIFAYALVGEGGNVSSNGLELNFKGEIPMKKDKKELEAQIQDVPDVPAETGEAELGAETEVEIPPTETETDAEVSEETPAEDETVDGEDNLDEGEESEETDGEAEEGETEETTEDEVDGDEGEADEGDLEGFEATLSALVEDNTRLTAENESLKEQVLALKKDKNRLSAKLKSEKEKKAAFLKKAKGLSVKLGVNETLPTEKNDTEDKVADYVYGNGIGEL